MPKKGITMGVMENMPSPYQLLTQRKTLQWLLVPGVLLPMSMVFLFTFARFFAMLGDSISAKVLDCIALGLGFLWFLNFVSLIACVVFYITQDEEEYQE